MPQYNIKQVKGSTQGSVLFLSPNGSISENNLQLFWSSTQSSLSIGTSSATSKLSVVAQSNIPALSLGTSVASDVIMYFYTNNSTNNRAKIYVDDTLQTFNLYTQNNDTIFWNGNGLAQTKTLTLFTDTSAKFENNLQVAGNLLVNGSFSVFGVGLNNPAARLHVSGTSMAQPLIIASGSSTGDLVRITHTGTGNSFVVEDSANPDTTQFVIDANGNVGIGLTAPSVKLHVTESTRVTRFGTYSYLNLGISNVIESQYFTNSISAASSNVSIVGTIRPMGLTTNSLSTNAGVLGLSYWDRDTSVGLGNANLLSSSPVLYGTIGQVIISATGGTVSVVAGVSGVVANQLAGVTVSNMFAFRAAWNNSAANNGYTGNYAAFYMPNESTTAPNIGNKYGIYIDDPNAANVFLGNMAIGTTTSATTSTYRLSVSGTVSTSGFVMSTGAVSGYVLTTDATGNATWTNPGSVGLTGSVTTTNATNTLMVGCSASIPTGNAMTAWAYIVGKSPSGATSAVGGRVEGTFRNVGGTLTSVGVTSNISEDFSSGNPSFTLVASGTYVTVQVTGFVGATISWYGTMKYNVI